MHTRTIRVSRQDIGHRSGYNNHVNNSNTGTRQEFGGRGNRASSFNRTRGSFTPGNNCTRGVHTGGNNKTANYRGRGNGKNKTKPITMIRTDTIEDPRLLPLLGGTNLLEINGSATVNCTETCKNSVHLIGRIERVFHPKELPASGWCSFLLQTSNLTKHKVSGILPLVGIGMLVDAHCSREIYNKSPAFVITCIKRLERLPLTEAILCDSISKSMNIDDNKAAKIASAMYEEGFLKAAGSDDKLKGEFIEGFSIKYELLYKYLVERLIFCVKDRMIIIWHYGEFIVSDKLAQLSGGELKKCSLELCNKPFNCFFKPLSVCANLLGKLPYSLLNTPGTYNDKQNNVHGSTIAIKSVEQYNIETTRIRMLSLLEDWQKTIIEFYAKCVVPRVTTDGHTWMSKKLIAYFKISDDILEKMLQLGILYKDHLGRYFGWKSVKHRNLINNLIKKLFLYLPPSGPNIVANVNDVNVDDNVNVDDDDDDVDVDVDDDDANGVEEQSNLEGNTCTVKVTQIESFCDSQEDMVIDNIEEFDNSCGTDSINESGGEEEEEEGVIIDSKRKKTIMTKTTDNNDTNTSESSSGHNFDIYQSRALLMSKKLPLLFITGGPGTGKSFLLREVIKQNEDIKFLCVTSMGKAARRLEEFGVKAHTVKMIRDKCKSKKTAKKFWNYYTGVIVDEASQFTEKQLSWIEEIFRRGKLKRLILIGDVDQLPPIGYGNPFEELIRKYQQFTVYLRNNHRLGSNTENIALFYKAILDKDVKSIGNILSRGIDSIKYQDSRCSLIKSSSSEWHITIPEIKKVLASKGCSHTQILVHTNKMCSMVAASLSINENVFSVGDMIIFKKNTYEKNLPYDCISDETRNGETVKIAKVVKYFKRMRASSLGKRTRKFSQTSQMRNQTTNQSNGTTGFNSIANPVQVCKERYPEMVIVRDSYGQIPMEILKGNSKDQQLFSRNFTESIEILQEQERFSIIDKPQKQVYKDLTGEEVCRWAIITTTGRIIDLDYLGISEIKHAEVITGDSSQGSEYEGVIVILDNGITPISTYFALKLFYTMCTRAMLYLVILAFDDIKSINQIINSEYNDQVRYCDLASFLPSPRTIYDDDNNNGNDDDNDVDDV